MQLRKNRPQTLLTVLRFRCDYCSWTHYYMYSCVEDNAEKLGK